MATRGDAGDAPVLKQAGSAASYTGGDHPEIQSGVEAMFLSSKYAGVGPMLAASGDHPEIQSGEPKILSGKYVGVGPMLAASGDYPEIQSGVVAKIRSGKYVGVGPMLAASGDHPEIQSGVEAKIQSGEPKIQSGKYVGVGPMLTAGGFAGIDTIVAARYFSSIYHQAVKPPVLIHVPRTVQLPVVLQSPREHRIVTLFQNYMRRARVLGEEKVIALLDKREDRAEKKLDAERLKFEEEKKKFEQEKMKFEEYKKQFPQKAVVVEAEKKETMPASIASKIDTAEKKQVFFTSTIVVYCGLLNLSLLDYISLFEKVINAPTKAEQIVKTIQENTQVVDKRLEKFDTYQKVKKFIISCGTGVIMFFKDEIKEFTGLRAGDSSEGSIGGESNGMSNEGKSGGPVPKAVAAANGAVNGATSVPKVGSAGIDSGAPGAGGVTGADSAIGAGVDSGAGGGVSAPGAGGASGADSATGAHGANSVTGARGATGAPAGAGPKGE